MKNKIKRYIENLPPKKLGFNSKIKVTSVSKLGMGTSNLNYLFKIKDKKFIFRIDMNPHLKNKSLREFNNLIILEKYNLGPKAFVLDKSRTEFDSDFIIISYIEGKTSDKMPEYLEAKMFKKIGELCGNLHSVKINGNLKKLDNRNLKIGFKQQIPFLKKEYMNYINKNLKDKKFLKIINESFKELSSKIPSKNYSPDPIISQGDFCGQNVVVFKNKYKLIDFEDLEITDRASHLAHIFSDFGRPFEQEQKDLFLKEYFRIIKTNEGALIKRIENWIPIKIFSVFLWSVNHTLRIQNNEMNKEFIEANNIEGDFFHIKTIFKLCLKFNVINKKYCSFNVVKAMKGQT